MDPESLFSLHDHLEMLSRHDDPLDVLERTVDFEYLRVWLVDGLSYGDSSTGGRPPFDPAAMFKILIMQAQHNLSDARMEYMIRPPAELAQEGLHRHVEADHRCQPGASTQAAQHR